MSTRIPLKAAGHQIGWAEKTGKRIGEPDGTQSWEFKITELFEEEDVPEEARAYWRMLKTTSMRGLSIED